MAGFKTVWRCVAVSLALAATPALATEKFRVITTFTVIADMARNVAGDAAEVESITKAGAEIHNYQPTPRDILSTRGADLILWNGLNLEVWFEKFISNAENIPSVTVSSGITPISISGGEYSGKPNPHAWMGEETALIYVNNIRDALVKYDPANATIYQTNAEIYKARITGAMAPIKAKLAQIPEERRWLLTSEGAFSYLAKDLGLKEAFLWPINADQQGSPQQIRTVIDKVRDHKIPAIFSESTISSDPAKQVARETGIRYGGVLYVDSLSAEDGPVPTYIDLLQTTAITIATGLK